jgi:hypothetical protein
VNRVVVFVAVALAAAACGSTPAAIPSPSPSPSPSPLATPSPVGLVFKLSGINTSAAGTITVVNGVGAVTLELQINGLAADSSHVSHIHTGSCSSRGGIIFALNQVVADGTGMADTKTMVLATYPPASGTWYVVVHAGPDMQGANANYLLCGNLFS